MPGLTFRMCFLLFTTVFAFNCQSALAADPPDIPTLIKQLDDPDAKKRENAADKLADFMDPRITQAAKIRLVKEKDFHTRLALHYALASQGDRKALQPLIDSLHQTGHCGSIYLGRATGKDFGWDIKKWQKWFDTTSDEKFQQFIQHRWEQKPIIEKWNEFQGLYTRRYIGEDNGVEVLKALGLPEQLSDAEKQKLETLPNAKAWNLFEMALVQKLQKEGKRKEAARLLQKVATEYPDTYYALRSKELAAILNRMVVEDQQFKPVENFKQLSIPEQIKYHIYQIRNIEAYQIMSPGYPDIFDTPHGDREKEYNPAVELIKIGEPAVPAVLGLLEDDRLIRATHWWRRGYPDIWPVRYRTVAFSILIEIRSNNLYDQRLIRSYSRDMDLKTKQKIIEQFIDSGKTVEIPPSGK